MFEDKQKQEKIYVSFLVFLQLKDWGWKIQIFTLNVNQGNIKYLVSLPELLLIIICYYIIGLLEATENKFLYPVSKTLYELESVPPLHILGFALGVVLLSFIIIGGNLAEIYLFSPFCTDFCLSK